MWRHTRSAALGFASLSIAWMAVPRFVMAEDGGRAQTLLGEVVDPASYLKDGRRGPELADQTYEAVDGGQTLALLQQADDVLYLFLSEEPGEDPNELAYDYVGQQVKVTGQVYERGGIRGIVAASVEPLTPPGTEPASLDDTPAP